MESKKAVPGTLEVAWECPHCNYFQVRRIDSSDIDGGCVGHSAEDTWCYCPNKEFRKTLACGNCVVESEVYV